MTTLDSMSVNNGLQSDTDQKNIESDQESNIIFKNYDSENMSDDNSLYSAKKKVAAHKKNKDER
jgi:hypothetical protein